MNLEVSAVPSKHPQERTAPSGAVHEQSVYGKNFMNLLPDAICLIDLNWRIIFVNQATVELLREKSEDQFIGRSVLNFMNPKYRRSVTKDLKRCLLDRQGKIAECTLRGKDGHNILVEASASVMIDESGNPQAIVCVVRDIRARKRAESFCTSVAHRTMLAFDIITHDLSNQLQMMMLSTELLQESIKAQPAARLLDVVMEALLKSKQMISKVELMEQLVGGPLEAKPLDEALQDVLIHLIESHDDVCVHANLQVADALIWADESLDQLIHMLLDNAYTHSTQEEKHIWVRLQSVNGGYQLSVSDNEAGISDSFREPLFDAKWRQNEPRLYLCRTIIEKYGGSLEMGCRVEDDSTARTEARAWFLAA